MEKKLLQIHTFILTGITRHWIIPRTKNHEESPSRHVPLMGHGVGQGQGCLGTYEEVLRFRKISYSAEIAGARNRIRKHQRSLHQTRLGHWQGRRGTQLDLSGGNYKNYVNRCAGHQWMACFCLSIGQLNRVNLTTDHLYPSCVIIIIVIM